MTFRVENREAIGSIIRLGRPLFREPRLVLCDYNLSARAPHRPSFYRLYKAFENETNREKNVNGVRERKRGQIDNSRGAWCKKPVEKVIHIYKRNETKRKKAKKSIPAFHPNFNLFSKATVVSCPRPVYTPSMVYGRIFTTRTPFYNVARFQGIYTLRRVNGHRRHCRRCSRAGDQTV